jgi:hypothetical protein
MELVNADEVDFRVFLGSNVSCICHQEADGHNCVVAVRQAGADVCCVVCLILGFDKGRVQVQFFGGTHHPVVRRLVERTVVDATQVGHETD